jgi:hypothetical protein
MNPKLAASGLAVAIFLSTNAHAQVTMDASKVTCEQFALSKIAPVRSVALWLSGYYAGKRGSPAIDLQTFETNADKLESFCRQQKNSKLPVMDALEQALGNK